MNDIELDVPKRKRLVWNYAGYDHCPECGVWGKVSKGKCQNCWGDQYEYDMESAYQSRIMELIENGQ